jgi:NADPH2:quinone reductase
VRLHASGVNPSDWKIRKGGFGRGLIAPLVIPHSDGAGVIDAVGAGVDERIGERVWIWNGQWKRPYGTAAEYIALPAEQAVRLPAGVDFAAGACLGIPALTALWALRRAGLLSKSNVLVSGGAGAVGHYAVSSPGCGEHESSRRSARMRRLRTRGRRERTKSSTTATRMSPPASRSSPRARAWKQ